MRRSTGRRSTYRALRVPRPASGWSLLILMLLALTMGLPAIASPVIDDHDGMAGQPKPLSAVAPDLD